MREVFIVGIGHTLFGKTDKSFTELAAQAAIEAIEDAGISKDGRHMIDQLYLGTMGCGILNHLTGAASALADELGIVPAGAEVVENGPASGASALKEGYQAVASGMSDCCLVVGAETMCAVSGREATDFVATMLHQELEYPYGVTLPAMVAMFTRLYMEKYGVTSADLAAIAAKNHANACLNPVAHIKKKIDPATITDPETIDKVNPIVADPLRRYDICPISDGAAAVLLVAGDKLHTLRSYKKQPVRIAGIASATDRHAAVLRDDILSLPAVRQSAEKAYAMAGITPGQIDVAEIHDAFQILEIAVSEEAGLFERGTAHLAAREGKTKITGSKPINTSGGLKAKGHPVGATGVSQIVEIVRQLRGEAGARQVTGAKTGLAVNFGGFGNNIVSTVLKAAEKSERQESVKAKDMYYPVSKDSVPGRTAASPEAGACGKLLTWTRLYALPEGFEEPYLTFGIAQFAGGSLVLGRIMFDEVRCGMDIILGEEIVRTERIVTGKRIHAPETGWVFRLK